MNLIAKERERSRAAGYEELLARYQLDAIPNWHKSYVTAGGLRGTSDVGDQTEEIFPSAFWPGDGLGEQLEFALKYDGTNLAILSRIFQVAPVPEFLTFVQSKPTGKYVRRLWFLYEMLTGIKLPLEDLRQGNYVDLLEPSEYFTTNIERRVRRQRIVDNQLGDRRFCPTVRRTEVLQAFAETDFKSRCENILAAYSPELLQRALNYLYTKETKSSFEIEHVVPDSTRTERFINLLRHAEREDFCEKSKLIYLQNRIVDPRFRDSNFRTVQNYVGETVAWQRERIHYVCPKPEDLPEFMDGLIASHLRMDRSDIPAAIQAAAISYGFVFLHPFEDGNGRIHRFLIHNILARRRFTPEGFMFPVSASMLKHRAAYDASLESFSRPLLSLVDYSLDEEGRMTVHSDTALWYRYMDMTNQAEALYRFIEQTVETELVDELTFLDNYDRWKKALLEIVDMPDRLIDLFIRFCLQNEGRISARKRASHFDFLTDDEIGRMEQLVQRTEKPAG